MRHPQDLAKELAKEFQNEKLEAIYKWGCCAFVLMWCLGIEPEEDAEAVLEVARMIDAGVIGQDCTVKWAEAGKFLTGRNISVEFINIKNLRGIKERTPVRYDYNGRSHWVGVQGGKVAYNSLGTSVCVEKGKPVTMRKISFSAKITDVR